MPFSAAVGRVLQAAVRSVPPDSAELARASGPELVGAAFHHGVAGYLWRALQAIQSAPREVAPALETARHATVVAHLRTLVDLRALADVLDAETVDWLVVKGPVLAEVFHGSADLRGYGDLDVLVRPQHLPRALAALTATGSEILDRNWELLLREAKGEVHLRLPSGTALDLHWHLLNGRDARTAFGVEVAALFDRAVTVEVDGLAVRTLDAVDTLLYLALHTMLSGAQRLIWVKDLERVARHGTIDSGELARRARRWRAELVLAAAAQLVEATLGVPLVDGLPLRPGAGGRAWLAAAARLERRHPVARADGSGSPYAMMGQALRPTALGGAGVLVRRVARNRLQALRGRELPRTPEGRLDPRHPASDRFDAGGAAAREAFLRQVVRSGR